MKEARHQSVRPLRFRMYEFLKQAELSWMMESRVAVPCGGREDWDLLKSR